MAPNPGAISAFAAGVGAFLLPELSNDAAMLYMASRGAYTFQISGANGSSGVALGEIYDLDEGDSSSRLINASGLVQVGTGQNVAIAGFTISGTYGDTVLIRAVGPGLSQFGLKGLLAKPLISLFDANGKMQASNSGWGGDPLFTQMSAQAGAFPLDSESTDAMLVASIKPGSYTVEVTGAGGSTGLALIEVYEVQ
jgi:hypothetical protein